MMLQVAWTGSWVPVHFVDPLFITFVIEGIVCVCVCFFVVRGGVEEFQDVGLVWFRFCGGYFGLLIAAVHCQHGSVCNSFFFSGHREMLRVEKEKPNTP